MNHSDLLLLLLIRFSCVRLCDLIDGSPPCSPVPGILQARTLEWVAISFSNAWKWSESEVAQSCPTLSDPMDCSPPSSSAHEILQARVLEWGAIAFSSARTLTSTSAQWGGHIFKSKITNQKPQNEGNIALNRPWKGHLLRSWKLKQEGFCLSSAETHKFSGTSNFLPLCAYLWMIAEPPVSINLNPTKKF